MNLPRNVACQLFELGSPIWNGGKRVAGLARDRISIHNEITFGYIRKSDGQKSIPDHYYISREKILNGNYPTMNRGGTILVLIPFYDLEILHKVAPTLPYAELKDVPKGVREVFFNEKPTFENNTLC